MSGKVKCKVCHKRLHHINGYECKRLDCPTPKGEQFETLTFKDWKDDSFTVVQDLECTSNTYQWPVNEWEGDNYRGYC